MGTLFADPRIEALYRQLFDTPERRAQLGELLRAVLAEGTTAALAPSPLATRGWDGRSIGQGERRTPAEMEALGWWQDRAMVWPVAALASSTYGAGWAASSAVGPPTVFPHHGDIQGAWASLESSGGVQWLQVTFPEDAPPAVALRVFETCNPGAVFAITDEDASGDDAVLWQAEPTYEAAEARVLDVTIGRPRRLRRVRVWLDTSVSSGWNEIDTVALVAERAVATAAVDWRKKRPARTRRPKAKSAVAEVDPSGPPAGEGERLTKAAGVARLKREGRTWRWVTGATASSSYGAGWGPDVVVGPPRVFPKHGDMQGAWAPRAAGEGPQWLELTFAAHESPVGEVLVFETNLPGALYAVVALYESGATETLWQRPPANLALEATVLSVKVERPRPIKGLRLWVDTDNVSGWPEIDAVALVPTPPVAREHAPPHRPAP